MFYINIKTPSLNVWFSSSKSLDESSYMISYILFYIMVYIKILLSLILAAVSTHGFQISEFWEREKNTLE